MRLTTLARKVQITPTKLIAFLAENNIKVDNGINTKLNEKTVTLVMSAHEVEDNIEPSAEETPVTKTETIVEEVNKVAEAADLSIEEEQTESQPEAEPTIAADEIEIPIKIDLPNEEKLPKTGTIEDLEALAEKGRWEDMEDGIDEYVKDFIEFGQVRARTNYDEMHPEDSISQRLQNTSGQLENPRFVVVPLSRSCR